MSRYLKSGQKSIRKEHSSYVITIPIEKAEIMGLKEGTNVDFIISETNDDKRDYLLITLEWKKKRWE